MQKRPIIRLQYAVLNATQHIANDYICTSRTVVCNRLRVQSYTSHIYYNIVVCNIMRDYNIVVCNILRDYNIVVCNILRDYNIVVCNILRDYNIVVCNILRVQ